MNWMDCVQDALMCMCVFVFLSMPIASAGCPAVLRWALCALSGVWCWWWLLGVVAADGSVACKSHTHAATPPPPPHPPITYQPSSRAHAHTHHNPNTAHTKLSTFGVVFRFDRLRCVSVVSMWVGGWVVEGSPSCPLIRNPMYPEVVSLVDFEMWGVLVACIE